MITESNDHSKQRRIKNELIFKGENDRIHDLAENVLAGADAYFLPINFTCECSDTNCVQKIALSLEDYNVAHQYHNRFILVPGHEQSDIEQAVDRERRYIIVEKFAL